MTQQMYDDDFTATLGEEDLRCPFGYFFSVTSRLISRTADLLCQLESNLTQKNCKMNGSKPKMARTSESKSQTLITQPLNNFHTD
jgi:hypothetical protein